MNPNLPIESLVGATIVEGDSAGICVRTTDNRLVEIFPGSTERLIAYEHEKT